MMTQRAVTTAGICVAISCVVMMAPGCLTTSGTTVSGSVVYRDDQTQIAVVFSNHDRGVIRDYYRRHESHLPPGLAKKSELPPGLRKQVERNGHLPPGLEGERLPHDLERHLEELRDDYVRIRVGADIVLMNGKTRLIVDIVKDVAL